LAARIWSGHFPLYEADAPPGSSTNGAAVTDPGGGNPDAPNDPTPSVPARPEPDVRFVYANERTFLAWNRTALSLVATGVAATQFLPELRVAGGRKILGLPLIVLGAFVAAASYRSWQANQRAMRDGDPLPRSALPLVLSIGIGLIAVVAVILAAIEGG
jgi:putative membrane protein